MDTRAIATAAFVVLLAAPVSAQQLPSWAVADICRADSAPGQCAMFESRARNAVSSSWGVLTPDVQSACIEATRSPADRSWRVLAGCIEIETRRIKSKRAIATRDTPAAEPEAKSSAEPPAAAPAAPTPATPAEPATAN